MQAAVVLHPALLRLKPEAALQHVDTLWQRCSQSSNWQQQLQTSLSPHLLGRAIAKALNWDSKLAFMIQCGWAGDVYLGDVVQLTNKAFAASFRVQYAQWNAQQRQIQRQQQQGQVQLGLRLNQRAGQQQQHQQLRREEAAGDSAGVAFVQALQARLVDATAAAAPAAGSDSSAPAAVFLLEQHEGQQQQQQSADSAVDVFYDGLLASGSISPTEDSSSGSNGSSGGSSSWAEEWEEQEDEDAEQSQALQVHAGAYQPHQQHQEQQQQQQQQPSSKQQRRQPHQHHLRRDSQETRRKGLLPDLNQRSVNRREVATVAAQLSGLELYGTWLGCLVQPVDAAAAAPASAAAAAAATDCAGTSAAAGVIGG
jgi:hypothetical protein